MKDSGIEWIGEIPENWGVKPLKTVLAERKENNDPILTDFILSLTVDKGVIPYTEKTGGGNKAKEDLSAYKLAYPNDIVLNSMNVIAGSVGLSKYFGCVSPVYYMLYARDESSSIEYFNNIFQTKEFQRNLVGLGNGIMMKESNTGKLNTIRMRIPMSKLNAVVLPIPPTLEQERISNFLTNKCKEIDQILEHTKLSIENFKAYKQAVITDAITKGINPNISLKDSGVEWMGKIPEHWDTVKLKYVFKIKKEISNELGHDILSVTQNGLKIKDISNNEGQISADYSKYQFVEVDDFVMNHMDLLTGWVDCSKYNGVTSPDYRVFRLIDDSLYCKKFYTYLFQICYTNKIFYGLGQGVSNLGRWRLQTEKFINFMLPNLPLLEQQAISDYLDQRCTEIDILISQKNQIISELESYKKSLIYEYVTGKKEVD